MTRFRCIGPQCESSCCAGGWKIPVDRRSYRRAQKALGGSHDGRQEFDEKLRRVKTVAGKGRVYALTVLRDNGECSFLDGESFCSLQRRFGAEVLPDTCATYPRNLNLSGHRRELTGLTSCPEVARQLLLHEDALELDEVAPSAIVRSLVRKRLDDHPADPYTRYHDELRNLVIDMLGDRRFPLSSRLSFVAYFGARTAPYLHSAASDLDEALLVAEVERIQDGAVRSELHAQLSELSVDPSFSSRALLAMLAMRASDARMRELLDAVLPTYTGEAAHGGASEAELTTWSARFVAQKQAWAPHAARIDGYFANLASDYWAREWYAAAPNLLEHQIRLLMRLASLRFLLYGHPLLAAATRGELAAEEALDRAVVHVVHVFSRVFEHSDSLRNTLHARLASEQVSSLAHAVSLAHF